MNKKVIKLVLTILIILGLSFLIQTYSLAATTTVTFSNAEARWETSNYEERYKLINNAQEVPDAFKDWNNEHKRTISLINVPDNHYLVLATKLLQNESVDDWKVGKEVKIGDYEDTYGTGSLTRENGEKVDEQKFVMGAGKNNSLLNDNAYEVIPNVLCSEAGNGGNSGSYYIQSILSISPYEISLTHKNYKGTETVVKKIDECSADDLDKFVYLNDLAFFLNETYNCRYYMGYLSRWYCTSFRIYGFS
ncbi:MAG: hypothetical protein IJB90_01500 [Clostridia bacterium]|nr:hypothetical protein [Clostridia bacterium]